MNPVCNGSKWIDCLGQVRKSISSIFTQGDLIKIGYNRCVLFPTPWLRLDIKQKCLRGVEAWQERERLSSGFKNLIQKSKWKLSIVPFDSNSRQKRVVLSFVAE